AAIMGISPFRTARDVYYDKLGIAEVEGYEGNWVAMEMGNLLEGLVAEIFRRKTGFEVYQVKKMLQHPVHRFMLADVDSFITMWSCAAMSGRSMGKDIMKPRTETGDMQGSISRKSISAFPEGH
ncbi:MAG TPA: hypothetical protein DCZ91_23760, partial [Lachnospiraceae bacterium]|nr:hypothetical protein [Lachnospiraceae bacterium]